MVGAGPLGFSFRLGFDSFTSLREIVEVVDLLNNDLGMKRPPIRVLDVSGSPEERGHTHGAAFADEIRSYTEERIALVMSGQWSGGPMPRADVLDLAESMIVPHEKHSAALAAEMHAMAAAAGITSAEAIIVGGFTDFVDAVRAELGGAHPTAVIEDDCTAFVVPGSRTADSRGLYGQTWDMHDTATEHVILLRVQPDDGPSALVFTTCGALGQIGMSETGVCVGINNLTATDGVPGVTWPQVVREALNQQTAQQAKDVVLGANLAGGHNFLMLDAEGFGYSIEAMPSARPFDRLAGDALVHTNHTLFESSSAVQGERVGALQASSLKRLEVARELLDAEGLGVDDLIAVTREPSAVCQVAVDPYRVESSGAVIMKPATREFWACWGVPSQNEFQKIEF